ncbi:MAG TPA: DUF87 domain-containing protein [Candidatus Saccharimonadia bacterium]|nr:DUF87 domain-containing protein [Candidatus Saccharimonadia bacterium]
MNTHRAFIRIKPSPETVIDQVAAKRHFEAAKSLLTALGGLLGGETSAVLSLELVASNATISFVVSCPQDIVGDFTNHLYAAMPTCQLEELPEWTCETPHAKIAAASLQFTPPEGNLRSEEFAGNDPLQPVLEVLAAVPAADQVHLRILLESASRKPGIASRAIGGLHDGMVQGLRDMIIGSKYEPDKKDDEEDKISGAPFRANMRIIASSNRAASAESLVKSAAGTYHQLTIPGKSKVRYRLMTDISSASSYQMDRKSAFWLTATEAANLYHTPLRPKAYPQLEATPSTRLPIPELLPKAGISLGYGAYRSEHRNIRLDAEDRLRHTYVIGSTGTGKSTLMQSMILQDMEAGDGCCFIDPHGEVIDWLLPRIPASRADDVVLFDPSDPEALLGLNLLEWRTPHERDLLIQELILLFYKLFDPNRSGIIGPQFEHWLRNAALTITEPKIRGALTDIPRLFTDQDFSRSAVALSDHWAVKDFWNNQMAHTADFHKSEMLNYFTSKFGSFLGNDVMHQILSQRTSAFDVRTLMDRRKILLVNLSKGKLGSLNAQLLGALIVAKIQMAAMSRADVSADMRPPFYVYIDEFQNVVTDSFAQMLSEVRKYGVGLHLAHQYVDQLPENIKQAISGNVGTLMAFRLGHADAQWLAPHFAPLTPDDLTGIPPYHYHLRTLAHGQLTTPFTVTAPNIDTEPHPALALALRSRVRNFVAASRAPV